MGGAFGTLILLLVVTSAVSLFFMQVMQAQTTFFTNIATPSVVATKQVERGIYQHYVALLEAVQQQGQGSALAEAEGYAQSIDVAHGKLDRLLTSEVYRQGLIASQKQVDAYMADVDRVLALLEKGDAAGARRVLEIDALEKLKAFGERTLIADKMAADATAIGVAKVAQNQRNSVTATIVLVVVSIIIAIVLSTLVYRSISRRLAKLRAAFGEVSKGNLAQTLPVEGKDEIAALARDFNDVTAGLRSAFTDINQSMDQLRNVAGELEAGFERTTDRSRRQQHELDAIATAMNEMASTTGEVASSAENAASSANQADEQANNSLHLVESTTSAIHHLSRRITDVAGEIRNVRDSSTQIEAVLGVIQGIAEQTNLLALNAAIEAARAGEQGRGFAVVAQEVRKLAGRSAEEAAQIRHLVDDSVKKVSEGEQLVNASSHHLQDIIDSLSEVTRYVTEIAGATKEQSAGIDQINQAISQLDQVTHQNARLVQEASTASQTLDDRAGDMHTLVSRFHVSHSPGQHQAALPAKQDTARLT